VNNNSGDLVLIASEQLLAPSGLGERHLDEALGRMLRGGVDNADLYFQFARSESWSLEDGIVKEGSHSIDQGVGVRAMAGEKTGFAYSDELEVAALLAAADAAGAIARRGDSGSVASRRPAAGRALYPAIDPLTTLDDAAKVELLQRVDAATRALDPRVRQVNASLAGTHEVVLVYASDGTVAADVRPLIRLNVSVIVEENGRREQGYSGGGGRRDFG